jgi:hypothetical protein
LTAEFSRLWTSRPGPFLLSDSIDPVFGKVKRKNHLKKQKLIASSEQNKKSTAFSIVSRQYKPGAKLT